MVGEEEVGLSNEVSILQEGAGENEALNSNGNFEHDPHHGVTYFIRTGDAIKIGFASNLKSRLSGLQTSHPGELEVLAAMSAEDVDEYYCHQKFAHLRIRGEWFRAEQELLDFIDYAKLKFGEAAPHKPAAKRHPVPKAADQLTSWLHRLRSAHDARSPVGYRCSNLTKMIPAYQDSKDPARRAHLATNIRKTITDLQQLAAQTN